ncbi:MAG: phosphotransferase family protein [Deltaproteobacteria bacterium]|jgi:aminoglycoside phosphotransferase (APT) family kinase protein|nr:phosphotransferase family protein [Deltaproteobacteria bacterium]
MPKDVPKGICAEEVTDWFAAHVAGAKPPLHFSLITGGHSNLTYKVEDAAGQSFVLRRPPLGAVIATAHDMAREHRIIAAVGPTEVPVPPVLGLCEDESVNDAPFYVMAFVEGHVLSDAEGTAKILSEPARARLGEHVIEILAALHAVDPDAIGLGDLGRKESYLARQIKRWSTQWEKTRTRELPAMEEVAQQLRAEMPEQVGAAIVHGDYRLGNMLSLEEGRVAAVLDWELCTLGDPLADVGFVMNNWAEADEPLLRGAAAISPTSCGGFPSRAEFLREYSERTGRDVSRVPYYRAFQYWRLAAIVEGVLSRYLKGVMGGAADTGAFQKQVDGLADAAVQLLREQG